MANSTPRFGTVTYVAGGVFYGDGSNDFFGYSAASAGDVNNDGRPDLIVGAYGDDNNARTDSGSARVISGATGATLYTFNGDGAGDYYGVSVASAGDVNGDGRADVIIGAPRDDNIGSNSGSARVISGANGATLYTFNGDGAGDAYGTWVASAGDVNGDGRADLIIGAPGDDNNGRSNSGSARVISGINGATLFTFNGDSASDSFGVSVASAGDVNGDGRADLIVGARGDDNNGSDSGSARVISGATGATLYTFSGDGTGDFFGVSVASAGDVDGDGRADLIVGATGDDNNGTDSGSARVISGATGATLYTFLGDAAGHQFGTSVASAGDVDGDGRADLIVGAPSVIGRARVFSGRTGETLFTFNTVLNGSSFGSSVASAGDLNGDGRPDLLVGNASDNNNGAGSGSARLFVSQLAGLFDDASTFVENAAAVVLDDDVDLVDTELDVANSYAGATLTFRREGGANAADVFSGAGGVTLSDGTVSVSGTAVGTFTQAGGQLAITFAVAATPALADQVARGIAYTNTSDTPPASVRIQLTFNDGDATGALSTTSALTVTITATDDPAVAVDDALPVGELGTINGSVFANNGAGADFDPESNAFQVTQVNGQSAVVGTIVTLPSGALLTLNANGSFVYNPNGAFAHLAGPASGGSNTSATDSFTYTVTGGDTATMTVTVVGADSPGDLVLGSPNADNLQSGDGDDTLRGAAGNDTLNGQAGSDTADYSTATSGAQAYLTIGAALDGESGVDVLVSIENLTGSDHDDVLYGGDGANVLSGGLGRDVLVGLAGNDRLIGGSGANNDLYGGLGDDTYVVTVNDTLIEAAGEGFDTIETTRTYFTLINNFEALTFTSSADSTGIGTQNNDVITGGSGNDTLRGRGGNDTLNGGVGLDTADYSTSTSAVTATVGSGASNDGVGGVDTFSSIENLIGSAFFDTLIGDGGANSLRGGGGNDTLVGRGGNDSINGGAGVDTVDYSDANASVIVRLAINSASDGEGGTDVLVAVENVNGGSGDDILIGDAFNNSLNGGAGRDNLIGGAGNDTLRGGSGAANDLYGGLGNDTYVLEVNDTIVELADEGTDTVQTARAHQVLGANLENLTFTGSGAFTGVGNALNNVLTGGGGADTLIGLLGDDTYVVSAGDSVVEASGEGTDTISTALTYYQLGANLENLTFTGTGAFGRGNASNNVMTGSVGIDTLVGGLGDDTYVVVGADTIVEAAGEGTDTVRTARSYHLLVANVENLTFTGVGSFTGVGNAANNVITGGGGMDTLRGGRGDDILNGGVNTDLVELSGLQADYTITDLGGGSFSVVDNVGGRDGSDTLNGVERVRFSNGQMLTLDAGAPVLTGKDLIPQTLPGPSDDGFLVVKDGDIRLVLPGAEDDPGLRPTPQTLTRTDEFAVTIDQDGGLVSGGGWVGRDGHDPWLM